MQVKERIAWRPIISAKSTALSRIDREAIAAALRRVEKIMIPERKLQGMVDKICLVVTARPAPGSRPEAFRGAGRNTVRKELAGVGKAADALITGLQSFHEPTITRL